MRNKIIKIIPLINSIVMLCSRLSSNSQLHKIFKEATKICNTLEGWNRRLTNSKFQLISRPLKINSPFIMKIDSPQFKLCLSEEVKILEDLFTRNGYEIRIVGGAVRDLLMGIQPSDIDFATTAAPSEMKRMFEENNFRMINASGLKHGTITARIQEKNFEITTLRIDVATNGRHAQVEFTTKWALDANRRDLTINAMYLGLDGTLYDYFNGYEDLKNKRLVFVGDASTRIKEDYLRIIRYFRFYGKISDSPDNYDEDILKAVAENTEGLKDIAGERIWLELNKIFEGKFVGDVILKMLSLGIGSYIGIQKYNETEFKRVWDRLKMKDMKVKPMTLLTALFNTEHELEKFYLRIKPAKVERDLGYYIMSNRNERTEQNSIRHYQKLYISMKFNEYFVYELLKYLGKYDFLEEIQNWKTPVFPVKGQMLLERGHKGKEVGEILNHLKELWCEHDFKISAEKLLEHIPKKKIKLQK